MTAASKATGVDETDFVSGTTVRFVQMMVLMVAVTAGLATTVTFGDSMVWGCYGAAGLLPVDIDTADTLAAIGPHQAAFDECEDRYGAETPLWLLPAWPAVLAAATVLLFRILPRWRLWRARNHLVEPDADLQDRLHSLAGRLGLEQTPMVRIDSRRIASTEAVVFGSNRHPIVRLDAGLKVLRERDGRAFDAIVLHEFAHIRNRDVTITYSTVAMWRAFIAFVALPNVALKVDSFPGFGAVTLQVELVSMTRELALAVVAILVVHFARAEVLRSREIYADRAAHRAGADLRPLFQKAHHPRGGRRLRRVLATLSRTHPSPRVRERSLDTPAELFKIDPALVFTTGVAAMLIGYQTTELLRQIWPLAGWLDLVTGLASAALVTAGIGVALWRSAVWAAATGGTGHSGIRSGLWLGAGMVAGELVQDRASHYGWLPASPAFLLVPLAFGVLYCWWSTQCVKMWASVGRGLRFGPAAAVILVGGWLALAAPLIWWQDLGSLWAAGFGLNPEAVLDDLRNSSGFAGVDDNPIVTAMLGYIWPLVGATFDEPTLWIGVSAAFAVPLAAWLVRDRDTDLRALPPLRRLALAAAIGGGAATAAGLAAVVWIHGWAPPDTVSRGTEVAVFLILAIASLTVGSAVAAAVGIALSGRYRLVSALIPAMTALPLGFVGVLAVSVVDGCIDGFGAVEQRCSPAPFLAPFPIIAPTPVALSVVAAVAIAAVAGAAARLPMVRPRTRRSIPGARTRTVERFAAAGLCALALGFGATVSAGEIADEFRSPADSDVYIADLLPEDDPRQLTEDEQALLVSAWWVYGGAEILDRLTVTFESMLPYLEAAYQGDVANGAPIRQACADLEPRVDEAEQYFPIPHDEAQQVWSTALSILDGSAQGCVQAVDQGNSALLAASVDDLVEALLQLNEVSQEAARFAGFVDL